MHGLAGQFRRSLKRKLLHILLLPSFEQQTLKFKFILRALFLDPKINVCVRMLLIELIGVERLVLELIGDVQLVGLIGGEQLVGLIGREQVLAVS